MPRCELTGKGPVVKNLVSHSNIKTKSTASPNIQQKRVFSRSLKQMVSLKMATSTIRSMEHMGGFDVFLLNQPNEKLSKRALEIKNRIQRQLKGGAKSAKGAKS